MKKLNSGIFTPATRLLQLMPIAGKFFLMLLVFTLPLAYLSWKSVLEKEQQLHFYHAQQAGLARVEQAYELMPSLLAIRDREYAAAFGFTVDQSQLLQLQAQIDEGLNSMIGTGSVSSQQQLAEVQRLWQARAQNGDTPLARHNHLTATSLALRQYLQRLAEDYDVLLGSDLHAYQLSHISVDSMVYTVDLVCALRGLGAGIISRGSFTPDSFIKISYYAGELQKSLNTLQRAYQASAASKMEDSLLMDEAAKILAQSQAFLATTHDSVIDPDDFQIGASSYHRQGTEVYQALLSLHDKTNQALNQRLAQRIEEANWQKSEVIAISALITLLMLYLFGGFYYAMKQGIQQINDTLDAIAQGDFNQRAEVFGRDEIRHIGDNLNYTSEQLARLVKIAYSRS